MRSLYDRLLLRRSGAKNIEIFMQKFTINWLSVCHVFLLTISNILVRYPFDLLGFHTTWGAFTYPAIFILTDLTTRLLSPLAARKVIFRSMVPALVISYCIASFLEAIHNTDGHLLTIHMMPLRVAIASFSAYLIGQLLDILIFQRYRNIRSWWVAPMISSVVGNIVDTSIFFYIAFYHSSNVFLSQHWVEIATVDLSFKILIGLAAFVPIYGVVLGILSTKMSVNVSANLV